MKVKSFAGSIIVQRMGWRVSKYQRLEDKFPTFKARRTDKLGFKERYEFAWKQSLEKPDLSETLLRWCITK